MSLVNPNLYKYFINLEKDVILWRYMNMSKFEDLLKEEKMFFCRSAKFKDRFEGSLPIREVEYRNKKGNTDAFMKRHQDEKSNTIVNCWQIYSYESNNMWQQYLNGETGIAIQTNLENIQLAFSKSDERIFSSKVRYIDYEKDFWFHDKEYPHIGYNYFIPLIHKRIEFRDEREFRLLISVDVNGVDNDTYWKKQKYENGMKISVDLNELIEKIIVCPNTEEKERKLILKSISDAGFSFKVVNSALDSAEYY